MAKLTKAQAKAHNQACDLLEKDSLTFNERVFVLENWREDATHINTVAGAFFTPPGLARDLVIETSGHKIVDLCAGIGGLSFWTYHHLDHQTPPEITCIEINPDYVEVGKKILPEATWICADVLASGVETFGKFDCAIANPPFGAVQGSGKGKKYSGSNFEFKVIELASKIASWGAFIIPQMSAPFQYSGAQCYSNQSPDKYVKFKEQTGIELGGNCGFDTSIYLNDWHGVSPAVEIVTADFDLWTEADERKQFELFAA
jgi:hypothetical protein